MDYDTSCLLWPSLTLFYRKDDSVAFPDNLAKTLPNLIQFVLHYASNSLKLQTGLGICSRSCIKNNLDRTPSTVQFLRHDIQRLKLRIKKISHSLDILQQRLSTAKDDSQIASKMKAVSQYITVVKGRLKRREIQLNSALRLHSVLFTSHSPFIEKHKLSAIVRRFQEHQGQIKEIKQV